MDKSSYKVLALVTARGGSKGLPGKNIKPICGRPLITWTLEAIKNSKYITDTFISTDYQQIADVCDNYGFSTEELRPEYLAQDTSSSMDVIEYTIKYLAEKGKTYDYVLLLEPTSPLRKKTDIDNIIAVAIENPNADGVISVGQIHTEHPSIVKKLNDNGCIIPYSESIKLTYQRQQEDQALFPYGVGYLIKVSVFMDKHTFYTDNIMPYFIERWQNYEIDDIYDFMCIETIMKEKMLNG